MHAVSTNEIADILHYNDNNNYLPLIKIFIVNNHYLSLVKILTVNKNING